jgi:hypothetical protein
MACSGTALLFYCRSSLISRQHIIIIIIIIIIITIVFFNSIVIWWKIIIKEDTLSWLKKILEFENPAKALLEIYLKFKINDQSVTRIEFGDKIFIHFPVVPNWNIGPGPLFGISVITHTRHTVGLLWTSGIKYHIATIYRICRPSFLSSILPPLQTLRLHL